MRFSAKILAAVLFFAVNQSFSQEFSLQFDGGTNDQVSIASSVDVALDSGFTIQAWVYPTTVDGHNVVLSKSSTPTGSYGYMIYLDTLNQRITARVGDAAFEVFADSMWTLNNWVHIAVVHNNEGLGLFVDGGAVAYVASPPNALTDGNALIIGGVSGSGDGDPFYGNIDDVRIHHTALHGPQISADYLTKIDPSDPDLASYYLFNEGSGTTPGDSATTFSSIQDNGTFVNTPTWDANQPFPSTVNNSMTVSNSKDFGPGSLREAVALANSQKLATTDTFHIDLQIGDTLKLSQELLVTGRMEIASSGGILDADYAHPILRNIGVNAATILDRLYLVNGYSDLRGGALINEDGGLTLFNCFVSNNYADSAGGAIFNTGQLRIYNSSLTYNGTIGDGGAIYSDGGFTELSNTTIARNNADNNGGAYAEKDGNSVSWFLNNTIAENNADADDNATGSGGALYILGTPANTTLYNNIIHYNIVGVSTPSDIQVDAGSQPTDHTNNFVGVCTGNCPATYNTSDPELNLTLNNCGFADYYELQESSPAIDAPSTMPTANDICGNNRDDGSPDAGAWEFGSGPGPGPGSGYDAQGIAFNYETLLSPDTLSLADEQLFGPVGIGFDFDFYGSNYTDVYISSNGYVTFRSDATTGVPQTIADGAAPNALIAGYWGNLDPSQGGVILIDTVGTSPTQKFVVEYQGVVHFSTGTSPVDFQIILYEGSNDIEVHCQTCVGPGGENHTQGVENDPGDFATTFTGRNNEEFSLSNDGMQFRPSMGPGPSGYEVVFPAFEYSTLGSPTALSLGDDSLSNAVSLEFSFNFFNNWYDSIYISSNGYLSFFPDSVSKTIHGIPDMASPNAIIAGFWGDLNPSAGGSISYETIGTSPNKIFVAEYTNVVHHSDTANAVSMQIKLFESSNDIEVHCQACPSPTSEPHSQGIEDESGQGGYSPDGRSSLDFSLFSEATAFRPVSGDGHNGNTEFVLLESFDDGLPPVFSNGLFELETGDWEAKDVREDTLTVYDGRAAARLDHTSSGSELITPPIDGDSVVTFYYALPSAGSFGFEVLSSVDGGEFSTIELADTATSTTFSEATIDLNYPGSEVRLKIVSDGGSYDQDFIVDEFDAAFLTPLIGLVSPFDGMDVSQESLVPIRWIELNIDSTEVIVVEFSPDGGNTFETIVQDTSYLLSGAYDWFVDSTMYTPTHDAKLQIRTEDNSVFSRFVYFEITPPNFGTGEYDVDLISFGYDSFVTPDTLTLNDEEVSAPVPLLFNFQFYGSTFSQVHVSSNGFLSFLPGQGAGCCSGQYMPDGEMPNGIVAGYWGDLDPSDGSSGPIRYETLGTSPNQVFVLHYDSIRHVNDSVYADFQIKLFEGSNEIEVHCQTCEDDGNDHTQGIEDASGNKASYYLGRNVGRFSISSDAVRFAPAPTKYDTINVGGVDHIYITDRGQGTGTVTFTNDKVYVLQGLVYVNPGQALTIQPGTIVKGSMEDYDSEEPGMLVVSQGAFINAAGTASNPIVFTSEQDDLLPPASTGNLEGSNLRIIDAGLWGGVYILGRAPITNIMDEDSLAVEGLPFEDPRSYFGGPDPTDSSGVFKYVSIRHTGASSPSGTQVNGLLLAGVGSATEVHHIELYSGEDDGIEFSGGTVNVSDILINAVFDDAIGVNHGYTGNIDNFKINALGSDHALEIDGPEGSLNPTASFTLSNGNIRGFNGEMADFRLGARAFIDSLYFFGFEDPIIDGDGDLSLSDDSTSQRYANSDLIFSDFEFTLEPGVSFLDVIKDESGIQTSAVTADTATFATKVAAASNTVGADETVFTNWTLTTFDPQPTAQLSSRQNENDEEIPPGADEFFIYEFKWDALFGDVVTQSFVLEIEGTVDTADFASTDPFKLYYNVGVDDPSTATYFGASNFGAGGVGEQEFKFNFNDTIWESSTVFMYVKATLDSMATIGDEFRVAEPPNSNFTVTAPAEVSSTEMLHGPGFRIADIDFSTKFDTMQISGVTHVIIRDQGMGIETLTMINDIVYVLDGTVIVNPGATLTIEPGTIIKGKGPGASDIGTLVIPRGASINAVGTATAPIVFTSEQDNILPPVSPGNLLGTSLALDDVARWGGVIILGDAPISDLDNDSDQLLEEAPPEETRAYFGGANAADNSGTLQYVSIRHGGFETESLLLAGVGSGTTIDHVEILSTFDDGIELLGGTVNLQSVLVNGAHDDGIAMDLGYGGTINNFAVLAPMPSDHALEIEGPEGSLQQGFTLQNGVIQGSAGEIADFRENAQGLLSNVYSYDFEDPQATGQGDIEIADDSTSQSYLDDDLQFASLQFTYGSAVPDSVVVVDVSASKVSNVGSELGVFLSQVGAGTQTVGLSDSTAFDGWTATNFAPQPTALFGTPPLAGDSIPADTSDIHIYTMAMEVRFGSVTLDSLVMELQGTYSASDFTATPFELLYAVNTDDIQSATSLGDRDFGDGAPIGTNQAAWTVGQTFADGSMVYFYLTADLDSLAGANTFSVALPDTSQFFFAGSPTEVAVSLTPGEVFSILQGDVIAPVVTVDDLYVAETSPALTGTVDDVAATVDITVDGNTYSATVAADSTWALSASTIAPALAEGTYDVVATATDAVGNASTDATSNELVIDLTAPVVTIDTLVTTDDTPPLSGSIDDSLAVVIIQIDTTSYTVVNDGDGTWSLADSIVSALTEGIYDVQASATDLAGNVGVDSTTNELTVDFGAPTVSFNTLATEVRSPALSGAIDDTTAVVEVILLDSAYATTNNGDGTWGIAADIVGPLNVGNYDVIVKATDDASNIATDTTLSGLQILATAPVANAGGEVTVSSFLASWSDVGSDVTAYYLSVASDDQFQMVVEGFNELQVDGTSVTVTGLDYSTTYYYKVKAQFASGDFSEYSETTAVTTVTDPGTATDSLALVSIYEALGGDEWTTSDNWLVGRVKDWYGVEFSEARVRGIALDTNNLVGVVPAIVEALDLVTSFSISGNEITELEDISGMTSLTSLNVSENRLQFGTLERLIEQVESLGYGDQKDVLESERTLQEVGSSYTVRRKISGSANSYAWFRDEEAITNSGDSLVVDIESTSDEGVFHVEVTNSNVPELTLKSAPVRLRVSSLERDRAALLAIFEATGGADWTNGADWPNQDDILLWTGVGVSNNRVTSLDLSSSNVVGDLPDDILDIPGLVALDLSENSITALPDLTSLENLVSPNVRKNLLQFDDLEPNANITGIDYTDQGNFGPQGVEIKISKGSDYRIKAPVGGTSNEYQWSFVGEESSGDIEGGKEASYTITDIDYFKQGQYKLTVTNTEVPGLTLTSLPQEILATVNVGFIPIYTDIDLESAALDEGDAYLLKIIAPNKPFDSAQQVTIDASGLNFDEVVLGDYLMAIRTDSLILRDKDGRVDSIKLLPTYYRSTFLWEEADTLVLRDEIDADSLFMQQRPRPLTEADGDGVVGLTVESEFAEVSGKDGSAKITTRRKVKRAGCSLRRRRRATGGRLENEEYELVAYKETDDDGQVTFNNLPDGTYRLNIEYPGIPMDTTSYLEFEIGEGGLEESTLTLEATVADEGIAVELVEALGILRQYFKDLEVYPNPADKELNVRYKKLMSSDVKAQLLNLSGQVMLEEEIHQGLNKEMKINVEGFDEGIYLLRFYDTQSRSSSVLTYRVIIKRH